MKYPGMLVLWMVASLGIAGCGWDSYPSERPDREHFVGRWVGELTEDARQFNKDTLIEGQRTLELKADGSFVGENMADSAGGGLITYFPRQRRGVWYIEEPPGQPWSVKARIRGENIIAYYTYHILGSKPPYKLVDEFDPDTPSEAIIYVREQEVAGN